NLFVFNVSAADAKLLEAEFQERMTQKHIISQPPLHCYARITIPDHPQQFASIRLARPASWNASPERDAVAEHIKRQNQIRFMRASTCDRMHEDHLKQFLDVSLFADRIEKEASSIQTRRQRREEEQRLLAELLEVKEQHTNEPDPPISRYESTGSP